MDKTKALGIAEEMLREKAQETTDDVLKKTYEDLADYAAKYKYVEHLRLEAVAARFGLGD